MASPPQKLRLFLLPISTRQHLLYCERLAPPPLNPAASTPQPKAPLTDRITSKASETWASWEKRDRGWQKTVTNYGNELFKRIPFQEWGLKSLPPLTKARRAALESGDGVALEVHFPARFMSLGRRGEGGKGLREGEEGVLALLKRLATERQGLSRKRGWQAVALMPVSAPVALIPVIPNLPFFYLVFRAWSHYRALYGGKLLERALQLGRVRLVPSRRMDEMYTSGLQHPDREPARSAPAPGEDAMDRMAEQIREKTEGGVKDSMLLRRWNGKLLAEAFQLPEMEVEIERAVEQVEKALLDGEQQAEMRRIAEKGPEVRTQEVEEKDAHNERR